MKIRTLIGAPGLALILLPFALAQAPVVDAFLPSNTPNAGATVPEPFGTGGGRTVVQRIPVSFLTAAGIAAGDQLIEVALASPGSGTVTATGFVAAVGFAAQPWPTAGTLGNVVLPEFIHDSAVSGPFAWTVTANAWNPLNTQPLTQTIWDGVSDLALYLTATGITIVPSTGGPVAVLFNGALRHSDGNSQRNVGAAFGALSATLSDNKGFRLRLRFQTVPPMPQGTVSFPIGSVLSVGGVLTVQFGAPGHGGEFYMPIVSCTLGSNPIPGLPAPLALLPDACSNFYFNDPLAPFIFFLAPPNPGALFGVLDPNGDALGFVFAPAALVPPGLNITVHITFITLNASLQPNAVHGTGSYFVN